MHCEPHKKWAEITLHLTLLANFADNDELKNWRRLQFVHGDRHAKSTHHRKVRVCYWFRCKHTRTHFAKAVKFTNLRLWLYGQFIDFVLFDMYVWSRLFNVHFSAVVLFAAKFEILFCLRVFLMNNFDENGNDPFNVERNIDRFCWSLCCWPCCVRYIFQCSARALSEVAKKRKLVRPEKTGSKSIYLQHMYMQCNQVKVMETWYNRRLRLVFRMVS